MEFARKHGLYYIENRKKVNAMTKLRKIAIRSAAVLGAVCMTFSACTQDLLSEQKQTETGTDGLVKQTGYSLDNQIENYYDPNVVFKLPDTVSKNDDVSVIVSLNSDSLMDTYKANGTKDSLSEYLQSYDGKIAAKKAATEQKKWISRLDKAGIKYTLGAQYDTILNGFEVIIKGKDFRALGEFFSTDATLIIGETYMPSVTEVVTNDVEVYETGIFDSSNSPYQGDGVVVAVLDTGLDYTHTAFSVNNFTTTNERFTLQNVSEKIDLTAAARLTPGLTGQDVYLNKKVPFAYDYADRDPDVLPISSEHGTHVAGIIAGKDDEITGVAPNAQLAIMKVFSDEKAGAKQAWILDALDDCATLNVDVINMSLGSGCGFAREVDKEEMNEIYDKIGEVGISLITAAGNDYISTQGSEKNGSLNLTSNPDAGTVGSPSTYSAPLSVASVDGVKTPYFLYNGDIMYFNEAHTSSAKTKDFVTDILDDYSELVGRTVTEHTFEYVTIPGLGRASDYSEPNSFYEGKIVLVKRGTTTFEEKVRIALKEKGAIGVIIYNNISGQITMSVGKDVGAVCSLSQDDGEKLALAGTGTLTISKDLVAGPFMSDFSSWGPTSDLQIKPEITAHGGEILSAIPGQGYDRFSGTSMACPNQAGAAALIRQYVRQSGKFGDYNQELSPEKAREVTALVNQLMMSTADIVYNKNGLPYAVRKQGAGLVNITKAITAESFIKTYNQAGDLMDRTKFELGDDKDRDGVYSMKFSIHNIAASAATYDLSCTVLTEGVSETYTSHSDTTVSMEGRMLDGAKLTVKTVDGHAANGNQVTVNAGGNVVVEVEIVLSDEDKQFIAKSFEYGMYVEGFVLLDAVNGAMVDLNVPLLAFFGDWTEAPIFDEEYYDTNKDELNAGIDFEDKLMADAYATRVTGKLYSEYVGILGQYYFGQDPSATPIAADKEHIAISNQENDKQSAINSIDSIWAGLLRNVKESHIKIVEDATGEVVFQRVEYNQRKSSGVGTISSSSIDVEFSALEQELKNNTKYTVTVTAYIDYGEHSDQRNVRNVFEFPLFIDFQAPAVTGVNYRTEYDKTTKKTKLFADLQIYDNHYAMGVQVGQITRAEEDSGYDFAMDTFGKYVTPVYSSFNSTSTVSIELTDHVKKLKTSVTMDPDGKPLNNSNTFIAICYDYALNNSTFEIQLPDEVIDMYFNQAEIKLSPNETKALNTLLEVYPLDTWIEVLDYESSDKDVVDVVNQTLIAKKSGTAVITASGYNANGEEVKTQLSVKVLAEGEDGFKKYDAPAVNKFNVTGYKVNKAYYSVNGTDREIGVTDGVYNFGNDYSLSMYPSESVTLLPDLDSNFGDDMVKVTYKAGNNKVKIEKVYEEKDGVKVETNKAILVAQAEGIASVSVNVLFNGKPTFYSTRITVTVKDPVITQGMYLTSYKGLGGVVELPNDRGIEIIQSYAFSNYEYVDKTKDDIIDEEDPYLIKQHYIGDKGKEFDGQRITKVIIPDGVTAIESYAFAGMIELEEVVLPKSLVKIGMGAFYGCKNLKNVNLENVKFINKDAFSGTKLGEDQEIKLDSVVAIGNYAFENTLLKSVILPTTSQSLGIGAFKGNKQLKTVVFDAEKIKVGESAFEDCLGISIIDVNAAVIARKAFYNCTALTKVTLGKDVEIIGEYAFANTNVASFKVSVQNDTFNVKADGAILCNNDEVVLVAPKYNKISIDLEDATSIGTGAFAGQTNIQSITANKVTKIGDYAFVDCAALNTVKFERLEEIGKYAFYGTKISKTPNLENISKIGDYAFANSRLESVVLPSVARVDDLIVGDYAFANCNALQTVTVGDNVKLGKGAFSSEVVIYDYDSFIEEIRQTKDPVTYSQIQNYLDTYYIDYQYAVKDEFGVTKEWKTYYKYNFTNENKVRNDGPKSVLAIVTIGDNVIVGDNAFDGNIKLHTLTIGDGTSLGNYAFYNAMSLSVVDLSGVTAVGDYAFSGSQLIDIWWESQWQYESKAPRAAYEQKFEDGKRVYADYIYSKFIPKIAKVDLSNVETVGAYAFADNAALVEATIGNNDKSLKIGEAAFANTSISQLTLSANVEKIEKYAFYAIDVPVGTTLNLSAVKTIGEYAFAKTKVTEVTLAKGATVEKGAFFECEELSTVKNLETAVYIGAKAFEKTALTVADITSATYVGDFAFGGSKVQEVVFGKNTLNELGDNPFYGCEIETFAIEQEKKLPNGKVIGTEVVTTYDISDSIKVIDDVIYQVVENGGYEIITYPINRAGTNYNVMEGTVRVTARTFYESKLESVVLPSTLKTIGDRSFYGCENLSVVVFKSYEAPLFEEEYSPDYVTAYELPFTGELRVYEGEDPIKGLGIIPFYMWNATAGWNNFYFGANFVDRIGHTNGNLVMVKPANGKNYETFVSSKYFGTVVAGSNAATDATLTVIGLIDALPENITLSHKDAVNKALSAYNSLPTDQQALVKEVNYAKLNNAISMIEYLESRLPSTDSDTPVDPDNSDTVAPQADNTGYIVAIVVLGVAVLAMVAYVLLDKFVFKKK